MKKDSCILNKCNTNTIKMEEKIENLIFLRDDKHTRLARLRGYKMRRVINVALFLNWLICSAIIYRIFVILIVC